MDFTAVKNRLDDLPLTYKRQGSTYSKFDNAQTAALFRYTNAVDGLITQLTFSQAVGPWLNVWGQLFCIPRNANESDDAYRNRITSTLLSGRCTPVAIVDYLGLLGYKATIEEDFVNTAFHIQFSVPLNNATLANIATNLVNVRPAGVPFLPFNTLQGGLYIGTVDFLDAPKVTGAYLDTPVSSFIPTIAQATDNNMPTLPTLFLTDPTINPGL